ncbi:alpha/beta hydrolase fold domain-containing protein [Shigella flexneri]
MIATIALCDCSQICTQCTVIGIDYTLSPEARFPQAIEKLLAACCHFHQQAGDYRINMSPHWLCR